MTTTEIQTKNYERLDGYIDKIVNSFQTAGRIIEEYMNAAKEEGITENEAKAYLKEKIPKSTFYKYLPLEYKDPRKQNRKSEPDFGPPVDQKEEFNTEGMGVVDEEPEVESYTPPIDPVETQEASTIINSTQQELEEEIKELTKALEEQRLENKSLLARNPQGIPNLDSRLQIQNLQEENIGLREQNENLKKNQKPLEFIVAKDLSLQPTSTPTTVPPRSQIIILPHAMLLELVKQRANTGINGIMKLTTEDNIVTGIEVVNVQ